MQENVLDIPPQKVITKDNASVQVDAVSFYQIIDAARAAYEVEILHLVGCPRRIDYLVEGDGVDLDAGVILGDDLLRRDIEDVLLHAPLAADRVNQWHD